MENLRRTRTGRIAVRTTIAVLGLAVVGVGLVLVPLPGPGWLIVFAGLAIWSLEFRWAQRLNAFVRSRVSAWATWYAQQRWPLRIVVGALTAIFVLAIIAGATYLSLGPAPFEWLGLA